MTIIVTKNDDAAASGTVATTTTTTTAAAAAAGVVEHDGDVDDEDDNEFTNSSISRNNKRRWCSSCDWSIKKICIGLVLVGFIIFVIVDSLTNKYVKTGIVEFLEWIETHPGTSLTHMFFALNCIIFSLLFSSSAAHTHYLRCFRFVVRIGGDRLYRCVFCVHDLFCPRSDLNPRCRLCVYDGPR